jgi:hypothetical protein
MIDVAVARAVLPHGICPDAMAQGELRLAIPSTP